MGAVKREAMSLCQNIWQGGCRYGHNPNAPNPRNAKCNKCPVERAQRNNFSGNSRRLMRSRRHRIVAGVCGGIGEYLGISPTAIRMLSIIIPGLSWVTYVILWIAIPNNNN